MDSDQTARAAEPLRVWTTYPHAAAPVLEEDPGPTAGTAISQPDTAAPKIKEAFPSVPYYKLFRQDPNQGRAHLACNQRLTGQVHADTLTNGTSC